MDEKLRERVELTIASREFAKTILNALPAELVNSKAPGVKRLLDALDVCARTGAMPDQVSDMAPAPVDEESGSSADDSSPE